MEMMSIASGSSGNCIYIGNANTHILIDAGISGKRVESGLNSAGLTMKDISGICVTHEHNDHIKGLGVLARRYGVPIYTMKETWQEIKGARGFKTVGEISNDLFHEVNENTPFQIGDIQLKALPISHDAAHPVAYIAKSGEQKMGVVTDLGTYDESLKNELQDMAALLLEANHDIRMLEMGPYSYNLKRRILSDKGHLSNEASGQLLGELLHDNIKAVFLGHLSQENNYEALAYETVKTEITLGDNPYKGTDFKIMVAKRDQPTQMVRV
jgi:phosphoribosyl 1,2-cyclic phosphodiesterase